MLKENGKERNCWCHISIRTLLICWKSLQSLIRRQMADWCFVSIFGPSVVLSSTWHILQSPLAFDHTQDFFSGWNETHYILLIFLYLFIYLFFSLLIPINKINFIFESHKSLRGNKRIYLFFQNSHKSYGKKKGEEW